MHCCVNNLLHLLHTYTLTIAKTFLNPYAYKQNFLTELQSIRPKNGVYKHSRCVGYLFDSELQVIS